VGGRFGVRGLVLGGRGRGQTGWLLGRRCELVRGVRLLVAERGRGQWEGSLGVCGLVC
jgi:hypothetical protein